MFVKPREASPETQRAPEEGVFIIGTGLGEKPLSEAQSAALEPPAEAAAGDGFRAALSEAQGENINAAEAESGAAQDEDLEKTREFQALGREENTIKPVRVKAKGGKRTALRIAAALFLLALLCAGACVYIAEPWVAPEKDSYAGPVEEELTPATISVGETYPLDLELRPNEKISTVELDADLLLYNEDASVTAMGEYYKTELIINTREIRVVQRGYERDIIVFGRDITEEYFDLRARLREMMDIEVISPPRTELRDLRVIRQVFTINGVPTLEENIAGEIEELDTYDVVISNFDREAGYEAIIVANNPAIAIVTPVDFSQTQCDFVITGVEQGWCTATAYIGFWKSVEPEVYEEYLSSQLAQDSPELRENEIFVKVREVSYNIRIKARQLRYYYYRGRWYSY
ncbi:MAG: hypothetical protein Q4B42_00600 [Oscillospiraceae bacterium]|nr:hypothetical protein [Oscillospiraceae bacterium]